MKSTQLYDFTLTAGGTMVILADANFYKCLTSTGDIAVRRDGGSEVRPIRAGRGEREVDFQRLVIRDLSGAANSGTLLVGDSNFIDDTIVLSSSINVRPEVQSGFYSANGALAANTAEVVFSPGSNANGALLLSAEIAYYDNLTNGTDVFISKTSAPANITDGSIFLASKPCVISTFFGSAGVLQKEQYIAAGQGLYYISNRAMVAGLSVGLRACRYKLL